MIVYVDNIVLSVFTELSKIEFVRGINGKCRDKFDCLIFEMLFIRDWKAGRQIRLCPHSIILICLPMTRANLTIFKLQTVIKLY